jgi:hypothetical protein
VWLLLVEELYTHIHVIYANIIYIANGRKNSEERKQKKKESNVEKSRSRKKEPNDGDETHFPFLSELEVLELFF